METPASAWWLAMAATMVCVVVGLLVEVGWRRRRNSRHVELQPNGVARLAKSDDRGASALASLMAEHHITRLELVGNAK